MKSTTKADANDRPPQWLVDALADDPDLLRDVVAMVREAQKRSRRSKNPRR